MEAGPEINNAGGSVPFSSWAASRSEIGVNHGRLSNFKAKRPNYLPDLCLYLINSLTSIYYPVPFVSCTIEKNLTYSFKKITLFRLEAVCVASS